MTRHQTLSSSLLLNIHAVSLVVIIDYPHFNYSSRLERGKTPVFVLVHVRKVFASLIKKQRKKMQYVSSRRRT